MKISYRTKDEANSQQEEDFLKLSGVQRFYRFLDLMHQSKSFPTKVKKVENENFQVVITTTK